MRSLRDPHVCPEHPPKGTMLPICNIHLSIFMLDAELLTKERAYRDCFRYVLIEVGVCIVGIDSGGLNGLLLMLQVPAKNVFLNLFLKIVDTCCMDGAGETLAYSSSNVPMSHYQ